MAAGDVSIPGARVFPESITSTQDGALYIGSIGEAQVYRAAPGATAAAPFIKPNPQLRSITGVLADEGSGTLYVCTNDWSMLGVTSPGGKGPPTLMAYDLKTGAPKGSYVFPGNAGFCNDIAIGADGAAYVTDSVMPRVLRLKKGGGALEEWVKNDMFGTKGINLDGIAFGTDGNLYVTGFGESKMFMIAVGKDMSAGAVTQLAGDPVKNPDGFRALAGGTGNQFLLAEGGHMSLVTIDGGKYTVKVLADDAGAVGVTQVGKTAYVVSGELNYLFAPNLKGKNPPPFVAKAVTLK
ncbi:MAG TPA: hypothetical protein VIJ42_15595 [Stellaceae bacterium]